ncbi:Phosphatidylglycerophosphatase A [Granulibacter bethesdensis]|uniref:Phosphatidylglycerophosphatase A n=2 Tax=Granulibacter bethesdensis TaxID=364410 RepID=A0AAN0RDL9_9PROT|nr:Phosphatidylglycerophosphatase A [Granulibacter bethesdensis]
MKVSMNIPRFIASGFGSGLIVMQGAGTVGTAFALIAGAFLWWVSPLLLGIAALAACLGGWWAVRACGALNDPGWVVIDEFAGMWITMLALPLHPTTTALALAFLIFRVLDITKLGPIGWADRKKDAMGVMGDDILAGIAGALILVFIRLAAPHLLG